MARGSDFNPDLKRIIYNLEKREVLATKHEQTTECRKKNCVKSTKEIKKIEKNSFVPKLSYSTASLKYILVTTISPVLNVCVSTLR